MKIVFTNTTDEPMTGYEPQPAKKVLPEWYKQLESYRSGEKKPTGEGNISSTVKRCMPVFDVVTAGYLIFSFTDIYVSLKEGAHWYEWSSGEPIHFHSNTQAPTHPRSYGQNFPKWINPWSIETPKGYSSLFIPPTHRENPFNIFEGVVDTDTYTNNVNFPFAMNNPTFEGLIPAGTPIAQVIPFKRDVWEMEIGGEKEVKKARDIGILLRRTFFDGYKDKYRQFKEYQQPPQ